MVQARRPEPAEDKDAAAEPARRLIANIERVVVGKPDEVALVVAAFISGGHVLLEDVPGTAKTILARALAQSIDGATFSRIQCTPDLQPTDITGLSIYNQKTREFEFRQGPVFANVVLVDEVNRAMPRTLRFAEVQGWLAGWPPHPTASPGSERASAKACDVGHRLIATRNDAVRRS